jgi:hypothetical protein
VLLPLPTSLLVKILGRVKKATDERFMLRLGRTSVATALAKSPEMSRLSGTNRVISITVLVGEPVRKNTPPSVPPPPSGQGGAAQSSTTPAASSKVPKPSTEIIRLVFLTNKGDRYEFQDKESKEFKFTGLTTVIFGCPFC